nr:hypothetical protein [Pedobacter kyonggii]
MNKLMNWMMLSCKKATELIEKKSLVDLSAKEKIMLKLHTSMCDGCSAYQTQSLLIDELLQHHITNFSSNDIKMESLENRILSKLGENSL